jgi:hypothetical protein
MYKMLPIFQSLKKTFHELSFKVNPSLKWLLTRNIQYMPILTLRQFFTLRTRTIPSDIILLIPLAMKRLVKDLADEKSGNP